MIRVVLVSAVFVAACAPEALPVSPAPTQPTVTAVLTQAALLLPSRLLISRGDSSAADVYVVDRHGQGPRRLTSGPGIKVPVAASPNGTTFAYRVEPSADQPLADADVGLFIQDIESTARWSIIEKTQLFGHVASWSSDGRQIVFDAQASASARQAALYIVNADGSDLRRLSPAAVDDGYPSWSPGGKTIAFQRRVGSGFRLRSINVDGSHDEEISHGDSDEWPVWSPDGSEIALQSSRGIDLLNVASGEVRLLVPAAIGGVPISWAPLPTIAFACRGGEWVCVLSPGDPEPQAAVEGGFPIWLPDGA